MKITKNDVGRFAVTRGGSILKIDRIIDDEEKWPVVACGKAYASNGAYFSFEENDVDLIQWADEHPKYKDVFTWPVTDESK